MLTIDSVKERIKDAKTVLDNATENREKQEKALEAYELASSVLSPQYHYSRMETALRGEGNWAERERSWILLLDKTRRMSPKVNTNTINRIMDNVPSLTKKELEDRYKLKLKELKKATDKTKKIDAPVNTNISIDASEMKIIALLAKKLEKAELSDREKRLLGLVNQGKTQRLNEVNEVFSNPKTIECPFCFRSIDNEYEQLLLAIYDYANENSTEYEMVIGNIMRRALEAFSTFEYKKGMAEISCDERILSQMKNPIHQKYFQSLMYKLVLHGESHMEEKLKALTDTSFAFNFSPEEKKRTAKDVLCMIKLLNLQHIESYLPTEAIANIDIWCNSIVE